MRLNVCVVSAGSIFAGAGSGTLFVGLFTPKLQMAEHYRMTRSGPSRHLRDIQTHNP
jgi:hypothetical protein